MRRALTAFFVAVAVLCVVVIVLLATGAAGRFFFPHHEERPRTRLVLPPENPGESNASPQERIAWEENINPKVPLDEGEIVISVLNLEIGDDSAGEQIVAFRRTAETVGPVYITYIRFNPRTREYRRHWSESTAATQSATVSLYAADLIGDRNACVIVTGMNSSNEHTLTVFRRDTRLGVDAPFNKIAQIQIDGSIVIIETARSLAYQQGITSGESFTIAAYGQDSSSANILDQIETIYAFNPATGRYQQTRTARIPGSQIEQQRLRELLSGESGVFESFIHDLWYYVSPQGTLDQRQYVYFDTERREIIFFGDETQQSFAWQRSTPTRYGIYVICQNISISTLRRFVDIELESLDSIRIRVSEDVRLKITVSASWDGSYRRAGAISPAEKEPTLRPGIDAVYESPWGRIRFHKTGDYTIAGREEKGRYVFFTANGQELLELRPDDAAGRTPAERMCYLVEPIGNNAFSLLRVRVSAGSVQALHESQIILSEVEVIENS